MMQIKQYLDSSLTLILAELSIRLGYWIIKAISSQDLIHLFLNDVEY